MQKDLLVGIIKSFCFIIDNEIELIKNSDFLFNNSFIKVHSDEKIISIKEAILKIEEDYKKDCKYNNFLNTIKLLKNSDYLFRGPIVICSDDGDSDWGKPIFSSINDAILVMENVIEGKSNRFSNKKEYKMESFLNSHNCIPDEEKLKSITRFAYYTYKNILKLYNSILESLEFEYDFNEVKICDYNKKLEDLKIEVKKLNKLKYEVQNKCSVIHDEFYYNIIDEKINKTKDKLIEEVSNKGEKELDLFVSEMFKRLPDLDHIAVRLSLYKEDHIAGELRYFIDHLKEELGREILNNRMNMLGTLKEIQMVFVENEIDEPILLKTFACDFLEDFNLGYMDSFGLFIPVIINDYGMRRKNSFSSSEKLFKVKSIINDLFEDLGKHFKYQIRFFNEETMESSIRVFYSELLNIIDEAMCNKRVKFECNDEEIIYYKKKLIDSNKNIAIQLNDLKKMIETFETKCSSFVNEINSSLSEVDKQSNNSSFISNELENDISDSVSNQIDYNYIEDWNYDVISKDKIDISLLNDSKIVSLLENYKKIVKCLSKKGLNSVSLKELEMEIKKYEDLLNQSLEDDNFWKVAVVGSFSCGKSSFINSIIGEDIEPVDITPVNHANSIFTFGDKLCIKSDNKEFKQDEYVEEVKKLDSKYKEFLIEYPCETLKNIKLYDTPGFGSVNKGDSNKIDSDIELSKMAANTSDIIFYLVDLTYGTIDEPSLKYLKDINENKNLYIILTHSDKKSPKARDTVKEAIINQVKNIGLDKEKVFLYSNIKEKYEKDPSFSFYRGCIITLLKGLFKKPNKVNSLDLMNTMLINYYDKIKNIVYKFKIESEKAFQRELEKFYLNGIERIVDDFLNKNPNLIIDNKNSLFYSIIKERGWFSDTYWVCINDRDDLLKINNYGFLLGLISGVFIASIIVKDFCVNRFFDYKEKGFFTSVVKSIEQGEKEQEKIAFLIQKDYSYQREEVKQIILQHLNWEFIQENCKFKIKQKIENFDLSWKELDDFLKEIEILIKS